jgi:Mn-containing catalase
MNGGKGLSVDDINGKIDGEDRGKQDDAQKATTSLGDDAIGKKKGKITHSRAGKSSGQR